MSATFVNNGDGTLTVTFTYTGILAKIQDTVLKAAEYAWYHGFGSSDADGNLIDFATLTNQEKLDVYDARIKRLAKDESRTQHVVDAINAERISATAAANAGYGL